MCDNLDKNLYDYLYRTACDYLSKFYVTILTSGSEMVVRGPHGGAPWWGSVTETLKVCKTFNNRCLGESHVEEKTCLVQCRVYSLKVTYIS